MTELDQGGKTEEIYLGGGGRERKATRGNEVLSAGVHGMCLFLCVNVNECSCIQLLFTFGACAYSGVRRNKTDFERYFLLLRLLSTQLPRGYVPGIGCLQFLDGCLGNCFLRLNKNL